jgi:Domain of unknown function (DUF4091)
VAIAVAIGSVSALAGMPEAGASHGAHGTAQSKRLLAYPSSQSISSAGAIPGGTSSITLNTGIGEHEGAWLVVHGGKTVAHSVETQSLGPLTVRVDFGHFVSFGGKLVPDALMPWDGTARPTEKPNQPLYVRVSVPAGTSPGTYRGRIDVDVDGQVTAVPLTVKVFPVRLPAPGDAAGNMLSSFHLSAETYINKADALYRFQNNEERVVANRALYAWLAQYRISPASWGFGEPKSRSGYEESKKWWLDAAGNMTGQLGSGSFATMRIPISSNRQKRPIAGVAPTAPEHWCDYLRSVHSFWQQRGWLDRTVPYVYSYDEPGLEGQRLVARQAKATHSCFPGGKQLMTGNPTRNNAFLWDNRGGDDLDIWVVLLRRWYGQFTVPAQQKTASRERQNLRYIDAVRKRGKGVWSYTYSGVAGTPGFRANEPLQNPRMYLLWNALEGTEGVLYGQGMTNYKAANPFDSVDRGGEFILFYPGRATPIPSARLEQIRDGFEDAAILNIVRRKSGPAAVRAILGGEGLFSANASGVKLACNVGCELKGPLPYSWPLWSNAVSTPQRIEAAKLRALTAAR